MRRHQVPYQQGRRRLVVAVLALSAAAATAATDRSAAPTHAAAGATLVLDKSFDLKTSDPQRQYEPTGGIVDRALYDTLLQFKGADVSHPLPLLASSYTASKDARTYTFKLVHNAHFSDGTPLTSADVVFSFRRLVNLKGNPSFLLAGITTSAKGPYTVVLHSATPNPAIPVLVANTSLGIVNSKLVKAHGGSDAANASKTDKAESFLNSQSAGSGPYVLKAYNVASQVTMAANPHPWGGRKATFSTVVLRNVPAAAQLLDVQRGTNEISVDLSPDQASRLEKSHSLNVSETPSPNVFFLFANRNSKVSTTSPNLHFQNAIRYGLDYAGIVKLAGKGAVQATGVIPSMFLGALPPGSGLKTDLAKAKSELAASGLSNPTVKLEYPSDISSNGLTFGVIAQKIKSDLGQGRDHRQPRRQPRGDRARRLPRRHRGARPLVLGPGLPGSERLPRVPARPARRPARGVAGRLRSLARGARQEGGADRQPRGARVALPPDRDAPRHAPARSSRSSSRGRSSPRPRT